MTEQLDRTFAALAHPECRAILLSLAPTPMPATALATSLGLTTSRLLRHLVDLADAGLVSTSICDENLLVTASQEGSEDAISWLIHYSRECSSAFAEPLDVLFGAASGASARY